MDVSGSSIISSENENDSGIHLSRHRHGDTKEKI